MKELPLAGMGCSLDAEGGARQAERYVALALALEGFEREGLRLSARFGPQLDEHLLLEAIDIERGCCPFFEIDWRPEARVLSLAVPDAEHAAALDALAGALSAR